MRRLLALTIACLGSSISHDARGTLYADPLLFGDVHPSRPYGSLSDVESLALCEYLYERGGFADYPDDSLPCPAEPSGHYFLNPSSCAAYYHRDIFEEGWPTVGDVVLCERLRVNDCNAGRDTPSPATETICRRIPVSLCTGDA